MHSQINNKVIAYGCNQNLLKKEKKEQKLAIRVHAVRYFYLAKLLINYKTQELIVLNGSNL